MSELDQRLDKVKDQLTRVQVAWLDPVDWSDQALYGFYCLENAVVAVAEHLQIEWKPTHRSRVEIAKELHVKHGLSDVSDLLIDLNSLRFSEAYGEAPPAGDLDPEQVAATIESYVGEIREFIAGGEISD